MIGALRDVKRVIKRRIRRVRDVDHHAQPVHLAHHVLAERRQAIVMHHLGVVEVALRVGPVVGIEVGERHIADAERIVVAQQAQRVFNRVAAFDPHQRRDLVLLVRALDLVRGRRKDKVIRMRRDDVGPRRVDHLQRAVRGVVAFDILGIDDRRQRTPRPENPSCAARSVWPALFGVAMS